MNEMMMMSALY